MDRKELMMSGFDSTGSTDLVAAYIIDNTEDHFILAIFNGLVCDNGIRVKVVTSTSEETCERLEYFQSIVNEMTGSDCLQLMIDI